MEDTTTLKPAIENMIICFLNILKMFCSLFYLFRRKIEWKITIVLSATVDPEAIHSVSL